MKRFILLGVLFLGLTIPVPAAACVDEDGKKVPCEKPVPPPDDPPPGGGSLCWGLTCQTCGKGQHPVFPDITWDVCKNVSTSAGCGCNWVGDKCVGQYGVCEYTG